MVSAGAANSTMNAGAALLFGLSGSEGHLAAQRAPGDVPDVQYYGLVLPLTRCLGCAGNLLKPMLGRGELRCIGATTLDEYRKHIEKDPALERRFQQVYVDQPSVADTVSILRGLRERCAPAATCCKAPASAGWCIPRQRHHRPRLSMPVHAAMLTSCSLVSCGAAGIRTCARHEAACRSRHFAPS